MDSDVARSLAVLSKAELAALMQFLYPLQPQGKTGDPPPDESPQRGRDSGRPG